MSPVFAFDLTDFDIENPEYGAGSIFGPSGVSTISTISSFGGGLTSLIPSFTTSSGPFFTTTLGSSFVSTTSPSPSFSGASSYFGGGGSNPEAFLGGSIASLPGIPL